MTQSWGQECHYREASGHQGCWALKRKVRVRWVVGVGAGRLVLGCAGLFNPLGSMDPEDFLIGLGDPRYTC